MADRIVELQREDGLWSSGLLDASSYKIGEVSGSALFGYALASGVNQKLLNKKKYKKAAEKAWIGLNRCVREDGQLVSVQGAGDRPSTFDFSLNSELYGTGAFLLAGSEVFKMMQE
jgi:rhamnogalacturonyl hydrolase YesR